MGFSNEFIKNASEKVTSKTLVADYEKIEKILKEAVKLVAEKNPYFDPKDVAIYLQGSYACKTNIQFQSKLEVVVEVEKTREYDPDNMKMEEFIMHDNFYVEFNHFYDVKRFKENLISAVESITGYKVDVGPVNFTIPMYSKLEHDIDICPCFSYRYYDSGGGNVPGKLVHNKEIDENYLMFTNLHAENGELKDEATKGRFKQMVRFFKTITGISRREDGAIGTIRGYYIECLLYNVPNEMFFALDGEPLSVFHKIINWLNFADMSNFVCQNQIWSLWGGADGFWNQASAKQYINDVIEFHNDFPSKRTEILPVKNAPAGD